MLTFKTALANANVALDRAAAEREDAIATLLKLYEFDCGQSRRTRLADAVEKLGETDAVFDAAIKETERLEHIEQVTNEIADPFTPSIAAQLRAAGIDDERQREIANAILADEPAEAPDAPWLKDIWDDVKAQVENVFVLEYEPPEIPDVSIIGEHLVREPIDKVESFAHEPECYCFDDSAAPTREPYYCAIHKRWSDDEQPWIKADIGCGTIEYQPGDPRRNYGGRGAVTFTRDDAMMAKMYGRPSLHGDGHVGPVEQHARRCAICGAPDAHHTHPAMYGLLTDDEIPVHVLECLDDDLFDVMARLRGGHSSESETDNLIDEMRAEVEAAYRGDRE